MKVTFYTMVNNCGDGSVYVKLYPTKEAAEKAEQEEEDKYGEGWAEPSVQEHIINVKEDGTWKKSKRR